MWRVIHRCTYTHVYNRVIVYNLKRCCVEEFIIGHVSSSASQVCSPNPCMNAGDCVEKGNSYTCNCVPGYTGIHCELGRRQSWNAVTRSAHVSCMTTYKCNLPKLCGDKNKQTYLSHSQINCICINQKTKLENAPAT